MNIMADYNREQLDYRNKLKARMKRQLQITDFGKSPSKFLYPAYVLGFYNPEEPKLKAFEARMLLEWRVAHNCCYCSQAFRPSDWQDVLMGYFTRNLQFNWDNREAVCPE